MTQQECATKYSEECSTEMKEECFESSGHECTKDVRRKMCCNEPTKQCSTGYLEVYTMTDEKCGLKSVSCKMNFFYIQTKLDLVR